MTSVEITKKQDEVLVLESEISIILWNLREALKKCAMQSSDQAPDQKSKPGEYTIESQGRDLDLTIKVLSECKKNLVKQLKEFRRKHDMWEVD